MAANESKERLRIAQTSYGSLKGVFGDFGKLCKDVLKGEDGLSIEHSDDTTLRFKVFDSIISASFSMLFNAEGIPIGMIRFCDDRWDPTESWDLTLYFTKNGTLLNPDRKIIKESVWDVLHDAFEMFLHSSRFEMRDTSSVFGECDMN